MKLIEHGILCKIQDEIGHRFRVPVSLRQLLRRATVIPAGFWRVKSSMEMVLRGWELILGYHSSMPRNLCGLQVGRQSWSRDRFRTKGYSCGGVFNGLLLVFLYYI